MNRPVKYEMFWKKLYFERKQNYYIDYPVIEL